MATSSSTTLLIGLVFCVVSGEDFGWKNREEVQSWYDNLGIRLSVWLNGTESTSAITQAFADSIKMSQLFEEYWIDMTIIGKDDYVRFATPVVSIIKSFRIFYDVKYFHKRHASVEFFSIYQFIDGEQIEAKGEITSVWNKNGELIKWIYFAKPGVMEAVFAKFNALSQSHSTKQDL